MQCHYEVKAPQSANCIAFDPFDGQEDVLTPQSNVYFVSSRRPKLDILNDECFQHNLAENHDQILNELESGDLEGLIDMEGMDYIAPIIDSIPDASIAYAARLIEKKIETRPFYCDCCKYIFAQNEKLDGINSLTSAFGTIESNNPCVSTFYICKIVHRFLKIYEPKCFNKQPTQPIDEELNKRQIDRDFRVLFYMIFQEIDVEKVYSKSDFAEHEEHKFHQVHCQRIY